MEQPSSLFLSDTILDSATCSTGGTVLVTVTGGAPNYSYEWSDGANQDTDTAVNLASGIYKVVVTDNNGCKDSITNVTVPVIGGVTVVVDTVIDILCFGAITGGINITTNGVLPISYSWTGPNGYTSTSEDVTNSAAGNYSVTITDGNSCVTAIDTVITTPASDISIIKEFTDLKCFNDSSGSIEVKSVSNGSAPYVYNWTGPNGYTSSSEDITNLAAGVYVLSLTDNNLCTLDNDSTIVLEPDTVSITYVLTQPGCGANDGSILVTPSGGGGDSNPPNSYNYSWVDLDVGPAVIGTASLLDNIGSGLYEVTVTDDSSCVGSKSVNVSDINGPLVEDSTVDVTCNNDTDGEIFLTVTTQPSGNAYGIDWDIDNFIGSAPDDLDGLPDSLVETGLPPGVYFVRVTDSSNGCLTVHSDTVFDPGPIVLTPRFVAPTCFGLSNGKAYPENISGGNGGYSYSWSDVANQLTDTAFNLAIGSYTLTVTDSKFCLDSMTVDVTQPDSLSIIKEFTDLKCFNDSSGSIEVKSVSNGSAPYVYNWTGPNGYTSSSEDITNLAAGVYVLSLTDNNLCTLDNDSTIVLEPDTVSITYVLTQPGCGANDGSILVTPSGGGGDSNPPNSYNYSWVDLDVGPAVIGTASLLDNIGSGLYEVTVTDDSSCVGSKSVNVSDINGPLVEDSTVDVTCNNDTDGEIFLTVTTQPSGNAYGIDWDIDNFIGSAPDDLDGLPDSLVETGLPPGVYFVRVTDSSNGCLTVHSDTVFDPGPIVLTPRFVAPTCFGLSNGKAYPENISGGNGGYSYSWSDVANQLTDTAFNLAIGSYTLTVTDSKFCLDSMTVDVTQPDSIYLSLYQDSVKCFGDSNGIAFPDSISGGSGGFTYSWDLFAVDLNSNNANNDTAIGLYARQWTLTVEDQNGCNKSLEIEVLQPEILAIGSMIMDSLSCNGLSDGKASAVGITGGNGVNSFIWTDAFGVDLLQDNDTAVGLSAETYTIEVTDQNNCSATADILVEEPNALTIDSIYQESVKCYGFADGRAVISNISGGTGYGYNFTWTDSLGNNLFQDSSTAMNLLAGVYSITVTDSDACFTDTNVTVIQPNLLIVDTISQVSVTCSGDNDGSAYVEVIGGTVTYNFTWTDSLGNNLFQDSSTAINLSAGIYNITVTDQNLCSIDTSIMVLQPAPLLVDSILQDSILCNGSSNGAAYVGVTGGIGTYNFTWTDSLGNNLFQDSSTAVTLSAGVYNITVTDQLLCSIDTNVTVLEPNTLTLDTLNIINPLCSSSSDGSVNLITNGGTNPYSFVWTDSLGVDLLQDNDTAVGLSAGIYYALVTDTNGCTAKDTVTLIPVLEILANAGMEDTLVCFGDSLTLTGTSSGAINPSISWNLLGASLSFDSTIIYTFEDSSTYIYDFVFVVSEQTCTDRDSVKITVAPLPTVDAGNDVDLSFGSSFDLGGTPTGPVNSSYIWTPLTNFVFESDSIDENPEIEFNSSEIYIVLVTDSNGCINSDTIKVNLIPDIVVPSAFSPNGDGINDVWIIEIPQQFTNVTVRVYNRWGSLVYDRAQAGGENWTGNGNNSKSIPVGTYYYIIEYIDFDGQKDNMNGPGR